MNKRRHARSEAERAGNASLGFSTINYLLILAGLGSIAAGYVLLGQGSTVAAPLLLVLGYVALIPLGIIR